MTGELYPEKAPNTVNNFIALANSGYYDGLSFHRVIPGCLALGVHPDGLHHLGLLGLVVHHAPGYPGHGHGGLGVLRNLAPWPTAATTTD